MVHMESLSLIGNSRKEMMLIRNYRVFLLEWNLGNIIVTAITENARMHLVFIFAGGRCN